MTGWVKLYRELIDKPIWLSSTPEQKTILVTILLMANHESKEWEWNREKFSITKGQFVTSLQSIANRCGKGISVQNVRTAISRFSDLNFLTYKSTKMGRIITICNWCKYQPEKKETNKGSNNPLTTNKNERNNNSDYPFRFKKKTTIPENFHTTVDMREYAIKSNYGGNVDEFTNGMILSATAKGYTYKDWHAAWKNWLRLEMKRNPNLIMKQIISVPIPD